MLRLVNAMDWINRSATAVSGKDQFAEIIPEFFGFARQCNFLWSYTKGDRIRYKTGVCMSLAA